MNTASPVQHLLPSANNVGDEPSVGSLGRLEVDGLVETRPFPLALARLVKWQSWLQVGGELVVRTRDPWAIDRVRRMLVSIGFRVERCESTLEGDTHETTIWAVQMHGPDIGRAQRIVRTMLAETYAADSFDRAWEIVQREIDTTVVRSDSGIVVKPTTSPAASIIMLTFNALEDTKKCLASVEAHTTVPYELIIVDNASHDGTPDFLRAYAAERSNVRLVLNDENTGFAAGNNLGLAIASGEYAVLLNNDTIVTTGWLQRMIQVCEASPEVRIVGPRSNHVSGAQLVSHAPYQSEEQLQAFAERWALDHAGNTQLAIRLVGFCLLVHGSLIAEIGGLDERFGRGNFEDDDFCLRAAARGFEARIADDVFIHHTGSQSFKAANIDYRAALETNWRIFKAKWGIPSERTLEEGYPSQLSPPEQAMQFIDLPDIEVTHHADAEEKVFAVTPPPPAITQPTPPQAQAQGKSELEVLFDDAEAAAQHGKWEESLQLFDEMVKHYPTFGPGYVGLASAAFATGQVQAGVVALEHACVLYPDNISLITQLGVALAHAGELERAQAKFLEVLDIDQENIDAIVSLAHLCRASKNFVEAVDLLDHAGHLDPQSPVVLGAIGATALELGDQDGARTTLERLQLVAPHHPETTHLANTIASI